MYPAIALVLAASLTVVSSLTLRDAAGCSSLNSIVQIMRTEDAATPFCTTLLNISPTTSTSTITTTPDFVTKTKTVGTTDTVTTTSIKLVSTVTTTHLVNDVKTVSTCSLQPTANVKRAASSVSTPNDLKSFPSTDLSSACGCLSLTTPTSIVFKTSTAPTTTITSTVASQAYKTTTVVSTSTTATSTSIYQVTHTYTYSFLPYQSESARIQADQGTDIVVFNQLDFIGQDITNFFCYPGAPPLPPPFSGNCTSFKDCNTQCVQNNYQGLTNKLCEAVVYHAPPDGSSGSCYLKHATLGCGTPNANVTLGVIFPIKAYNAAYPDGPISN